MPFTDVFRWYSWWSPSLRQRIFENKLRRLVDCDNLSVAAVSSINTPVEPWACPQEPSPSPSCQTWIAPQPCPGSEVAAFAWSYCSIMQCLPFWNAPLPLLGCEVSQPFGVALSACVSLFSLSNWCAPLPFRWRMVSNDTLLPFWTTLLHHGTRFPDPWSRDIATSQVVSASL